MLAAGAQDERDLPEACLQHQSAWLLEGRDPPTLPDPMDWPSPLRQVALTAAGQTDADPLPRCGTIRFLERSGRCRWSHGAHRASGVRRFFCQGLRGEGQSAEQQAPFVSRSAGEGNLIRSQRYRLQPRVLGGIGKPAWFLNGQRLRWDEDQK